MPPKIRELKSKLLKAGFTIRSGKGSHTVWHHPSQPEITVILSVKMAEMQGLIKLKMFKTR